MKKLALIIAVAGIVGLSSCSKGDTVCKKTMNGAENVITFGDKVESCAGGTCVDVDLQGVSQDNYIKTLEVGGYECE